MKSEAITKLVSLFCLFAITFFFCMLPLLISRLARKQTDRNRRKTCERILSSLNCVGGGVFLATCLLHLFPEAKEEMVDTLAEMKYESEFPLSEFVMAFGFLLVLATEQIVLALKKPKNDPEIRGHSDSIRAISNSLRLEDSERPEVSMTKVSPFDASKPVEAPQQHGGHSHSPSTTGQSALGSILLVLALSLHSIFEGLAIGLQETVQDVLRVLGAVIMHKCIIAFTLGLNLVQSKFKWQTVIISNFIFAIMSPLGIGIALIVMSAAEGLGVKLSSGILQSLAAGTFLYVTFFEVLPHELDNNRDRLMKLFCIIIGFSIMTMLIWFLPA